MGAPLMAEDKMVGLDSFLVGFQRLGLCVDAPLFMLGRKKWLGGGVIVC